MTTAPASLPKGNELPVGNDHAPRTRRRLAIVDGPFAETKEYALCSRHPSPGRTHPVHPRAA